MRTRRFYRCVFGALLALGLLDCRTAPCLDSRDHEPPFYTQSGFWIESSYAANTLVVRGSWCSHHDLLGRAGTESHEVIVTLSEVASPRIATAFVVRLVQAQAFMLYAKDELARGHGTWSLVDAERGIDVLGSSFLAGPIPDGWADIEMARALAAEAAIPEDKGRMKWAARIMLDVLSKRIDSFQQAYFGAVLPIQIGIAPGACPARPERDWRTQSNDVLGHAR